MDYLEISQKLTKLEGYFEKNYNTIQKDEISKRFEYLTSEQFDELMNIVIENCVYLPKIVDFNKFKEKLTPAKKEEKQYKEVECKLCKNTGLIEHFHVINGIEYGSFYTLCGCKNAEKWRNQRGIAPFQESKTYKEYQKRQEKQKIELTSKMQELEKGIPINLLEKTFEFEKGK